MGGEQAANVLATIQRDNIEGKGKVWSLEAESAFKDPILRKYAKESHAFYSRYRFRPISNFLIMNRDAVLVYGMMALLYLKNPEKYWACRWQPRQAIAGIVRQHLAYFECKNSSSFTNKTE